MVEVFGFQFLRTSLFQNWFVPTTPSGWKLPRAAVLPGVTWREWHLLHSTHYTLHSTLYTNSFIPVPDWLGKSHKQLFEPYIRWTVNISQINWNYWRPFVIENCKFSYVASNFCILISKIYTKQILKFWKHCIEF